MRLRREELVRDKSTLLDVLVEGSKKARERAVETMDRVRAAIGLDYRAAVAAVAAGRDRAAASRA
jgi:hypothetical protein